MWKDRYMAPVLQAEGILYLHACTVKVFFWRVVSWIFYPYKNVGQNWYIYNFLVRHLKFCKSDDKFTFSDHGDPNIIILTEIAEYIFFGSAIFDPPSWIFWNLTSDSCSADLKAHNDQHLPCKMNTWESYPQLNLSQTLNAFISKHFSNWWDISRLQFLTDFDETLHNLSRIKFCIEILEGIFNILKFGRFLDDLKFGTILWQVLEIKN